MLAAATPFTIAASSAAQLTRPFTTRKTRKSASNPQTVLISGMKMTKALVLARAFHAAGHRVIGCESEGYELSAHRFSRALDGFEILPRSDAPHYAAALTALIERYGIEIYVPVTSPAGSLHDSALIPKLSQLCEVLHAGPDTIEALDDKAAFAAAAQDVGLKVPRTVRVTSTEDVLAFDFASAPRPFILKSIAYDPIGRLDLTQYPMDDRDAMARRVRNLPIRPDNPYVLQEFIPGTEYCTHGFFREGQLRVHCCCASSAFQVNYAHVDEPDIRRWVEGFGAHLNLTGQASFDFIKADDDGEFYAIECNPRTHSAITLFAGDERLAAAHLSGEEGAGDDPEPLEFPVQPRPTAMPTYWSAHQFWRLIDPAQRADLGEHLAACLEGRDAVFDPADPLPFLALHHVHIPALLLKALAKGEDWHRIDFNIGKLVKEGGD